jgi:hypothetical protein
MGKKKLMPIEDADLGKLDTDSLIHFTTTLIATLSAARRELRKRIDEANEVEQRKENLN